ncbi:superoxide dismutase[Cu-Zn] [Mycobacterium lacus]|uniref:Superoxide dismutase [Cu-Zn] n=1 Tax=Mycobacterium lacus TaxID=169765 RepID=A0A1X1YNK8_9MYCO|nr:superoxide dismutase family protein [Mycobacterium lacus]MCV7124056.1 superoxide dismutase family protein [Mycobacterium lacus]ORW12615.1 superoxide dismutase [Mycobacterium lacus]BBX98439.1 superoxide dismutase [Cu-Zn] [Mycobacterium lacus]
MPKPAGRRHAAAVTVSALSLAACVALLSACSSPQHASTIPGTTPSVWTGSPAPSSISGREGPAASESLTTVLKGPDGTQVATAKFEFANGFATITLQTTTVGVLSPGFHGVHIHKVGKCEPNSVAPTGGAPGDFLSAGGHFQPGRTGRSAGDLTSLQVRGDGSGTLVTTTDAFTMEDLLAGSKTAIIIHSGADNFANIPAERYTQANGTPGPDETTMTTGDAGKRVACGVIGAG